LVYKFVDVRSLGLAEELRGLRHRQQSRLRRRHQDIIRSLAVCIGLYGRNRMGGSSRHCIKRRIALQRGACKRNPKRNCQDARNILFYNSSLTSYFLTILPQKERKTELLLFVYKLTTKCWSILKISIFSASAGQTKNQIHFLPITEKMKIFLKVCENMKKLYVKTKSGTVLIDQAIVEKYHLKTGTMSPFSQSSIVDENGNSPRENDPPDRGLDAESKGEQQWRPKNRFVRRHYYFWLSVGCRSISDNVGDSFSVLGVIKNV
jgi:hypothetical protein